MAALIDMGKRLLISAKNGETEDVRVLIANGAPFTTDWLGTTPLHLAAQNGHTETCEILLRGGISRDAKTKVDRTALHAAAQEGHLAIVQLLLDYGAEVDARDMLRMTPLHWATEKGHILVVETLLSYDADVKLINKFDKNTLDIAEENNDQEIIDLLKVHISNVNSGKKGTMRKPPKIIHFNSGSSPVIEAIKPLLISGGDSRKATSAWKSPVMEAIKPFLVGVEPQEVTSSPVKFTYSQSSRRKSKIAAEKSPAVSKPAFIHGGLQKQHSSGLSEKLICSDSEDGDASVSSSTNVLATLAALAEATAPNASISSTDAMQWLEQNGITMLPTDNSTIVETAVEGGQTVALTEAGKLALTWVKEHQSDNKNARKSVSTGSGMKSTLMKSNPAQKVIRIIADKNQMPSIIRQQPIVIVNNPSAIKESNSASKKQKIESCDSFELINGRITTAADSSTDAEQIKLKNELESIRKEAELYKAQLLAKEEEAERYRRQLEEMKTNIKLE